jgi:hypothetical protein
LQSRAEGSAQDEPHGVATESVASLAARLSKRFPDCQWQRRRITMAEP